MDLNECVKIIDNLIQETDKIINSGAKVNDQPSLDTLRDISTSLRQFIRTFFDNAEERIKDYNESLSKSVLRNPLKTFLEEAKVVKRYLNSIKDSLRLRMTTKIEENKLDVLERAIKEKTLESERRGAVVETKVYGAAIEIIDKLRDELKNNNKIFEEVTIIKKDVSEIKNDISILLKKFEKEFFSPTESQQ